MILKKRDIPSNLTKNSLSWSSCSKSILLPTPSVIAEWVKTASDSAPSASSLLSSPSLALTSSNSGIPSSLSLDTVALLWRDLERALPFPLALAIWALLRPLRGLEVTVGPAGQPHLAVDDSPTVEEWRRFSARDPLEDWRETNCWGAAREALEILFHSLAKVKCYHPLQPTWYEKW